MQRLLGPAALLFVHVTMLQAQQTAAAFEAWNASLPALAPAAEVGPLRLHSVDVPRRDYRYEGLAIGVVVLGAAGAWIGSSIGQACPTQPGIRCSSDRFGNGVVTGLAGALVGGGLGYLVGRLSAKPEPEQRGDGTR